MSRRTTLLATGAVLAGLAVLAALNVEGLRRVAIEQLTPDYDVEAASDFQPTYAGKDADRQRVPITLTQMAPGVPQPTDIQFVPGDDSLMIVLGKQGTAKWFDLSDGSSGVLLEVEVLTASEEGLLGLAFHPDYAQNGAFYINYVTNRRSDGRDISRVHEVRVPPGADLRAAKPELKRVLMEVAQPYQNHDAGQLAFGPDGQLYIGWGDGGYRYDPHNHGQDTRTWLGAMLRVQATPDGPEPYVVPADNPFVGDERYQPEIWAYGLRNPWRYAFAPDGRLVVADVGQDLYEEVSVVGAGDNMGWKIREATHCFEPKEDCPTQGLVDPIYEYGRDEGQSITGGYVYTGAAVPALQGLYVFGDFVGGRLWAIPLPAQVSNSTPLVEARTLGRWPILPSTFGQDARGEVYVADFASGAIYRIDPG
ncbi:MAG: PQQ-dependent sugar dehydrogenase [Alphaproteobacteria bacterium]|nr:PQQ-dependent sugar dehydrogenase [Alphaproteobacteria bacterium]